MDIRPFIEAVSASPRISFLHQIQRGLEKESLRLTKAGDLSLTPHPAALGAALTHPNITTDYSESLLEFVTTASTHREKPLSDLQEIHQFVYAQIPNELLWPCSMPCRLAKNEDIPIAYYGKTNEGLFRYVYRRGLGFRYGRAMQMIAGIHYNFSIPEGFWAGNRNDGYLGLIRNYLRFGWIFPWLFGASPHMCTSFFEKAEAIWHRTDEDVMVSPHAVSLRLSDVGYRNKLEGHLFISHNSLNEFIGGLHKALHTTVPSFQAIGVHQNSEWLQLNDKQLQIEAEYYGIIRPKNKKHPRLIQALKNDGIDYVELRAIDLDPRLPLGLNERVQHFCDLLLVFCALYPSPFLSEQEEQALENQHGMVVSEGRNPDLFIQIEAQTLPIHDAALVLVEALFPVAELLDKIYQTAEFTSVLDFARKCALKQQATTSAAIVSEMTDLKMPFSEYGLYHARKHKMYFDEALLSPSRRLYWENLALQSLEKAATLESIPQVPFEDYLKQVLGYESNES